MDNIEKELLKLLYEEVKRLNDKLDDLSLRVIYKDDNISNANINSDNDILFVDFYCSWLQEHKKEVEPKTYFEYVKIFNKHIKPYFETADIKLLYLTSEDIETYYADKMLSDHLSPNTVLKHHANIYSCLKYAKNKGFINLNPMDNVKRPKAIKYIASYYTPEQLIILFQIAKDNNSNIYTEIILAGLLGLRRSEIVALKWSSIDFIKKTITIRRKAYLDENNEVVITDRLKTKSSYRTLCLPDSLLQYLQTLKKAQFSIADSKYKTKEFLDYVCLDENGYVIRPDAITMAFRTLIKNNDLPFIRFHDLRHSCASMLLSLGYDLKKIQEWLGHADIQTTANIYLHINNTAKYEMANTIDNTIHYAL